MKTNIIFILSIILFSFNLYSQTRYEDFDEFSIKFFSDSSFQKERTKFPLLEVRYNAEYDRYDTMYTTKQEWSYSDQDFLKRTYRIQVYDNEKRQLRNTGVRIISYEGIENGIDVFFCFRLIKNKWFLVKYSNQSD